MDRSSYYASTSSSASPRPNKVIMQRAYRLKEGECFEALKDIIHKLTGKAIQTRHEVLKSAIDLLLTFPGAMELREVRVDHLTPPYDIHPSIEPNDAMLNPIDYSVQSPSPQIRRSPFEPDPQMAYYSPYLPSQGYPVSGTDPNSNRYGEGWQNLFY